MTPIRKATFVGLISLLVLLAFAATAAAGPIAAKKAEARGRPGAARARSTQQSDMAVEQYNEATTQLKNVQDRITHNQHLLKVAEYKLGVANDQLTARARQVYKADDVGIVDVVFASQHLRRPAHAARRHAAPGGERRRHRPRRHGLPPGDQRPPHRARGGPQVGRQAGGAARGEQEPGARAAGAAREHRRRPQERDRRPRGQGGGRGQGQGRGGRARGSQASRVERLVRLLRRRRAPAAAAAAAPSSTPAAPATRPSSPSPSATSASPTCGAAPARAASTAPASPCTATRRSASASRTAPPTSSAPAPRCSLSALQPGDLVFFGSASYSHHVGIYVGGGSMIDAPHTGAVVSYDSISGAWIGGRF